MRVAALTGGRDVPSARFRVRQYTNALAERGIEVREYFPSINRNAKLPGILGGVKPRYLGPIGLGWLGIHYASRVPSVILSHQADLVWLSRELVRWGVSYEPLLKRPLVFDVDDAIWLKRPFVGKIAKSATAVFAGNQFLADWFSQHNSNVFVVPTAIDTDRFKPRDHRPDGQPFTVGWTGSSPNLRYLAAIEEPLAQFLRSHPSARLLVVCNQPPTLPQVPASQLKFVYWTPENEADAVAQMDVGLMPLDDGDWERGKCSFKMLQYMACSIPVVVSPVGMNTEVLANGRLGLAPQTPHQWLDALDHLVNHSADAQTMGRIGCEVARTRYAVDQVAAQIAQQFRKTSAL